MDILPAHICFFKEQTLSAKLLLFSLNLTLLATALVCVGILPFPCVECVSQSWTREAELVGEIEKERGKAVGVAIGREINRAFTGN